ncbi:MAG: haloacid dehalogenase-like hydrolase [Gemmatimonadales bacterium]|nr:haloacid dehalogenase-like hydrolase [Gemmatimonadales bacterium]
MLLFWDIDGTLLTTGRAGIYAWEDALRETTSASADLQDFHTAGHPDFGIARRLLAEYGGIAQPDARLIRQLVGRYEDNLPAALHRRAGRVLPNVRDILEALDREPEACCMLLTGNTRRGAHAKLAHYGLAEFFRTGAFSEDDGDRVAIALKAMERATTAGRAAHPRRVFVIGDTPHDIHCAEAIGARAVAVATGLYPTEVLEAEGAWRVFSELPTAAAFLALLEGRKTARDA